MSTHRTLLLSVCAASLGLAAFLAPSAAAAQGFATPPSAHSYRVIESDRIDHDRIDHDDDDSSFSYSPRSVVRVGVGPVGRLSSDGASPGLLTSLDFGRGPAGFRLTGAWIDVGSEHGLSQYTGELTVDFGGRSRFRPVIGAGAGLGRTSSSVKADGSLDPDSGAWLGVGIVRAGLGVVLPFDEADARVGLDLIGSLAAIRADNAPPLSPWLLSSLTVSVGF
jgi:hypothetical protein